MELNLKQVLFNKSIHDVLSISWRLSIITIKVNFATGYKRQQKNQPYHNSFQDFIGDWRKDTFIVVNAKVGVDLGEHGNLGPEQDPEGDVHILQICNMHQHHVHDILV